MLKTKVLLIMRKLENLKSYCLSFKLQKVFLTLTTNLDKLKSLEKNRI